MGEFSGEEIGVDCLRLVFLPSFLLFVVLFYSCVLFYQLSPLSLCLFIIVCSLFIFNIPPPYSYLLPLFSLPFLCIL